MASTVSYPSARNLQVEALFDSWNLRYDLVDEFPIADIKLSDDTQVRDVNNRHDPETVERYRTQLEAGAQFPPIVVRAPGVGLDGFHRTEVARLAGLTTIPAYVVEIPTGDLARALGTALNMLNGRSLTEAEQYRQALDMMENLSFSDNQIANIIGRSASSVRTWRLEQTAVERAKSLDVEVKSIPLTQLRVLAKLKQSEPFKQVAQLANTRKIPRPELVRIVNEIESAPSEAEGLQVVARARHDLQPTGPKASAVVVNQKAKRARMILPQVVNLAPPLDLYEPLKATADAALWAAVADMAGRMVQMYAEMADTTQAAELEAANTPAEVPPTQPGPPAVDDDDDDDLGVSA